MDSKNKYLILGGALIALIALVYFMQTGANGSKNDLPEGSDTTSIQKPINPAGTYVLYNLLKNFDNTASIETFQTSKEDKLKDLLPLEFINGLPSLYISISPEFYLKNSDIEHLNKFVENGNYALISTQQFSSNFTDKLLHNNSVSNISVVDTVVSVNFLHKDYKQPKPLNLYSEELNFHGYSKYKDWYCFNDNTLSQTKVIALTQDEQGNTSAILIKHGKGAYLLQSQPSNFSNVNLSRSDGKKYAENLFSHFPDNNIKWHQNFSKYSNYRGLPKPKKKTDPTKLQRTSPLQFILKTPALFAALILIMAGLFLYMAVFSKRRQKIIPPIESNNNTSMEFVSVVSTLYFQQKQHNKLVKHLLQIFRTFILEHYYINLNSKRSDTIDLISEKSNISKEKITDIIKTFKKAKNSQFKEQDLIELYTKLDYFYKHCN